MSTLNIVVSGNRYTTNKLKNFGRRTTLSAFFPDKVHDAFIIVSEQKCVIA